MDRRPMRAAVCQMTTTSRRDANLPVAERLVRRAADAGADLVVLPEKWNVIDRDVQQPRHAEPLDGTSLTAAAWARELEITLVAGSVSEVSGRPDRAFNTCVVFDPFGAAVASYRKLHLFDVDVGGTAYRESAGTLPGEGIVTVPLGDVRLGLSVCYDLRFPELYRALADLGADILTVPAAFTATTGAAHWEVLLRARAIENQCFVLAAGQVGRHDPGVSSFGHSMIVDPWGTVLARVDEGEGIAVADLDWAARDDLRARLPVLDHRRASGLDE